jgi:hypothetical protein
VSSLEAGLFSRYLGNICLQPALYPLVQKRLFLVPYEGLFGNSGSQPNTSRLYTSLVVLRRSYYVVTGKQGTLTYTLRCCVMFNI